METFVRTVCPYCENEVYLPVGETKRAGVMVTAEFRTGCCPSCHEDIVLVDDISVVVEKGIIVKDTEALFAVVNSIEQTFSDSIVQMHDHADKCVKELNDVKRKVKVVLLSPEGQEITDRDILEDYIKDNADTYDMEEWINDNYDDIEIGDYRWSPCEILDAMDVDYSCVVKDDGYVENRIEASDLITDFDEIEDVEDAPADDSVVTIAGITFTYRVMERE